MQNLTSKTFKTYWQHSKKYPWAVTLTVFGMIFAVASDMYTPFLYKNFFNQLVGNNPTVNALVFWLWLVMAANFANWFFWRIATFATNKFEAAAMSDLLNTCFSYLQYHSYNYFNNNFAGSLVRRVNRFARSFEDIVDQVVYNFGQIAFRLAIVLVVLFFRSFWLGFIVLVWSIIYLVFNYWFTLYKIKYDISRAAQDTKITGQMADAVGNNINLKLFGGAQREIQSFKILTKELYKIRKFSWDLGEVAESAQGFLMVLLEFAVMYVAVLYWKKGEITVGDFVLLQAYLIQMFTNLWNFGRYIRRIYESVADANEMSEILLTPHEIQDAQDAKTLTVSSGQIEFQNVTYAYNQNSVFENFNLLINPREKAALIGPSGGGKSTIIKLLFRFMDLKNGKILIDDQDISEVSQESLRANLSLVPQDPTLFHRSLMENIRYARPKATDQEVIEAAKLAHAHEFISQFPEGYQTFVGERGVKLSGGERQRVAIARAILKDAPILLLDEATSSLDSESEHFIQDALKKLMRDKTTIVIAHRLSTIMQMDRIIVLEQGRITEQGKHEELIKMQKGTYQKLWEIQAGGFKTT